MEKGKNELTQSKEAESKMLNNKVNKEFIHFSFKKWIFVISMIVITIIIGGIVKHNIFDKNGIEIITSSQLKKIVNISELSTYQAVYNGIAKKENDNAKNKIDYYVSYESKVNAGLDIDKIEIDVDNNTKRIIVTLPEIKINDVNVDITSLDYIFIDEDSNTNTVSEEAYKLCINDVKNEADTKDAIYDLAKQNAKNIVAALLNPFVKQLDSEYVVAID